MWVQRPVTAPLVIIRPWMRQRFSPLGSSVSRVTFIHALRPSASWPMRLATR
jgi:hypothetical protein